jgi:hypothetical protein
MNRKINKLLNYLCFTILNQLYSKLYYMKKTKLILVKYFFLKLYHSLSYYIDLSIWKNCLFLRIMVLNLIHLSIQLFLKSKPKEIRQK